MGKYFVSRVVLCAVAESQKGEINLSQQQQKNNNRDSNQERSPNTKRKILAFASTNRLVTMQRDGKVWLLSTLGHNHLPIRNKHAGGLTRAMINEPFTKVEGPCPKKDRQTERFRQ